MKPNTIDGLIWGMQNFDGIEFDIRLSKDNNLVIHHDPAFAHGITIAEEKLVSIKSYDIPLLSAFIGDTRVQELIANGKTLWIELKPNCDGAERISNQIAKKLYQELVKELAKHNLPEEAIRILSFSNDLLEPFASTGKYSTYIIIPDVNECNQKFVMIQALLFLLKHSLKWHMKKAVKLKYTGVLFARQYLMGIFSIRHPSYKRFKHLISNTGIELGTNVGVKNLESNYPLLHRFTDDMSAYPRFANAGEGKIIAHRGTGTKGIIVS